MAAESVGDDRRGLSRTYWRIAAAGPAAVGMLSSPMLGQPCASGALGRVVCGGKMVKETPPAEDRTAHLGGVELACWTNRQVRRSGLCPSCWMRESEPDILYCDGGRCRNFSRLLDTFR